MGDRQISLCSKRCIHGHLQVASHVSQPLVQTDDPLDAGRPRTVLPDFWDFCPQKETTGCSGNAEL